MTLCELRSGWTEAHNSTDDAQTHCLKITEPKLVLVDEALAGKLGVLRKALDAVKVGPVSVSTKSAQWL